jgi:hypothetical protein
MYCSEKWLIFIITVAIGVNRMRSAIYSSLEPCRSLSRLLPLPDTVSLFNPSLSPVLLPLHLGCSSRLSSTESGNPSSETASTGGFRRWRCVLVMSEAPCAAAEWGGPLEGRL